MEACIITTYRCNAHCYMCNTWQYPSRKEEEIGAEIMAKIPHGIKKINISGGEPALRHDLLDIVEVADKKAQKVDISTNGYFTERLVEVGEKFPHIAFRISVEGFPKLNDSLRGIKDGFDRGLKTVLRLLEVGVKDVGFGIVISDQNKADLLDLYTLCSRMGLEFGSATMHNSFYFHKHDNMIQDIEGTVLAMQQFIEALLQSKRHNLKLCIKDWGRAFINFGILNHIRGESRPIPCGAGKDIFFLDPYGKVFACNGSEQPLVMGEIREKTFEEVWHSHEAQEIRKKVARCDRSCWMVGTARPAMRRKPWIPLFWIAKNKTKLMLGKNIWCNNSKTGTC